MLVTRVYIDELILEIKDKITVLPTILATYVVSSIIATALATAKVLLF